MDKAKIRKLISKRCLSIISQELLDLIKEEQRRICIRKWFEKRGLHGVSNLLLNELIENDIAEFTNCMRMSPTMGSVDEENIDEGIITEGSWRTQSYSSFLPIANSRRNHSSQAARDLRDKNQEYFLNKGSVSWQEMMIY
ncbi:hypothetical protein QTP88_011872 [Uroleucon formosanum]